MDSRELMRIDVETGFTLDARGRMLCSNEPREDARRPAPRVLVGHTSDGDIVRFNAEVHDAIALELEAILASAEGPVESRIAVERALAKQAEIIEFRSGPAYYCSQTPALNDIAVHITGANRQLARDTYAWLFNEVADWQPCFGVIRDGAAVSVFWRNPRWCSSLHLLQLAHRSPRRRGRR